MMQRLAKTRVFFVLVPNDSPVATMADHPVVLSHDRRVVSFNVLVLLSDP